MNRSLRNKVLLLGLTFVLAFAMTAPGAAQELVTGDTIPAGTIYDHDAVLIGENVAIDGTVKGNAFILGNQVTVNGQVDGSLILLGQNASIGGTVTGEVYAVLLTLDLAPNASIGRDLYVAAVSLTSGTPSLIGRDLYALGLDSGLHGQVGRELHTVIGPIQLYNGLMTLLGYDNLTLKLHFETPQPSTVPSGSLLPPGTHAYEHPALAGLAQPQAASTPPFDWSGWALTLLRNWAILFLFCLLAFWIGRKGLRGSGEALQAHPWRALGTGFLVLVISLASAGAALLLAVLIFALGLGLIALGVWPLTLALWAVAYALLAAALAALWAFLTFGTKIIVIHLAGYWVFRRLFSRRNIWIDLLGLLAGAVVYSLLRSIPYVGWIFGLLVTALGAGAAWRAYRAAVKKPEPVVVPATLPQPVEVVEALPAVEPPRPVMPAEAPVPSEPVLAVQPLPPDVPVQKTRARKTAPPKKPAHVVEPPAVKISRKRPKPAEPAS